MRASRIPARSEKGIINIGVMDYKLLDRQRTSTNLGDHVQTLAALSNICRFSEVDFNDGTELGEYLGVVEQLIHPTKKIDAYAAKVRTVPVDRDFASGRQYGEPTWLISQRLVYAS